MRLEAIDPQHPETVALLCGPLVLFPILEGRTPSITRAQLLAAQQRTERAWGTKTADGALRLLPYIAIEDEQYDTYVRLT